MLPAKKGDQPLKEEKKVTCRELKDNVKLKRNV